MNAEIKAEWIKALRSGEFEQTTEGLCINGKYCCLGVLSELAARAGVVIKEKRGTYIYLDWLLYDGQAEFLPAAVVKWADLPGSNPPVGATGAQLAALNDSALSFAEIADLIEESL